MFQNFCRGIKWMHGRSDYLCGTKAESKGRALIYFSTLHLFRPIFQQKTASCSKDIFLFLPSFSSPRFLCRRKIVLSSITSKNTRK